jgi:hypothetical protein
MTKRVKRLPGYQNSLQSYFVLIVETVRYPERCTSIGYVLGHIICKVKRDERQYYDEKYFFCGFLVVISTAIIVQRA